MHYPKNNFYLFIKKDFSQECKGDTILTATFILTDQTHMNNTHPSINTISIARTMQQNALSTYSKFSVGAALQTAESNSIGGFNIESASYGLTMCAERVALFSALALGHREFTHVVLVTNTASFPCGACRQMLYEFCPNAIITIATPTDIIATCSIQSLMPHAFAHADLEHPKKG